MLLRKDIKCCFACLLIQRVGIPHSNRINLQANALPPVVVPCSATEQVLVFSDNMKIFAWLLKCTVNFSRSKKKHRQYLFAYASK